MNMQGQNQVSGQEEHDYQLLLDICDEYDIDSSRLSGNLAIMAMQLKTMLTIKMSMGGSKQETSHTPELRADASPQQRDIKVLDQNTPAPQAPQQRDIKVLDQNTPAPPQRHPVEALPPTEENWQRKRAITQELTPSVAQPETAVVPNAAMQIIQSVLNRYSHTKPKGKQGQSLVRMRQQGAPSNVTGQLLLGYYLAESNPEIMLEKKHPPLTSSPKEVTREIQVLTYPGILGKFELLKPQERNDLFNHCLTFKKKMQQQTYLPFYKADEEHLEQFLNSLGIELDTVVKEIKIVKNRVIIHTSKNIFAFTPLFHLRYGRHVEITVYGQDARRDQFELHELPFSYMDDIKIEGKLDGQESGSPLQIGHILFDSRMASPMSPVQYFKLAGLMPNQLRGRHSFKATFTGKVQLNETTFNIDVIADMHLIGDDLLKRSQAFLNHIDPHSGLNDLIEKISADIVNVWERDRQSTWYFSNIFYWKSGDAQTDDKTRIKYEVVALLEHTHQGKKDIRPFVFIFYPFMGNFWMGREIQESSELFIPSQQIQLFLSSLPYSINFNKLSVKQPLTVKVERILQQVTEESAKEDPLFTNPSWKNFREACRRLQKLLTKMREFSIFQTEILQEVYIRNMPKVIRYLILDTEPDINILKQIAQRHSRFKKELFSKEEGIIKFIQDRLKHYLWARLPETEVMINTLKLALKLLNKHLSNPELVAYYESEDQIFYTHLSVLGLITEKSLANKQYLMDLGKFETDSDLAPFRELDVYKSLYALIEKSTPYERKIFDLLKLHDKYLQQAIALISQKKAGDIFVKHQDMFIETDRLLDNLHKTTNILKNIDSFNEVEREEIQACYQIFFEIILAHFPVPEELQQLKTLGRFLFDIPGQEALDKLYENRIPLANGENMTVLLRHRLYIHTDRGKPLTPYAFYMSHYVAPGVDTYNNHFPLFHSVPKELEILVEKAWGAFPPIQRILQT